MADNCSNMPLSLAQMLAAALVKNEETGEILGINAQIISSLSCIPAIGCDNNHIAPERMVVTHAFGQDDCGNIYIKFVNCTECYEGDNGEENT